jgi:hypothetical protein
VSLDLSAAAIALTTLGRDRKVKTDKVKVDKVKEDKSLKTSLKRRTKDEGEKWGKKKVRGLFSFRPPPA